MNTKKIISGLLLASATLCLVAPIANAATANGTSDATVKITKEQTPPGQTGSVTFSEVSTSANITFAEKTLTGAQIIADEATKGAAKIKITDSRENLASGKDGKYTVTVKDVTAAATANGMLKHNMVLKLASANVSGKGNHQHTPATLSTAASTLFTGVHETGVKDKEITLNPTLTIPAALDVAGTYSAKLEWTLTPAE